ncbi:outer membrane protein [Legionella cardiaca]|uniref:Outer membrane beta-barrel protein n=1 Tax=Legionella cardiaca TaxID=1071983 RepID=A0ABY8AVU3_9GAMM|nr:outer membrane beta-barrel protein [Legionella cardiaca]WED43551.1 outer membrane beta-barrel protein [Legionella cardiaca]
MLGKICLVGLTSFLVATPCFSGFYAGASVGPEGAHFVQKAFVRRVDVNPSPGTTAAQGSFSVVDKNRFSGVGVFGSIFAGYGYKYNQYYLAGEVNGNLSSVKYQLTNDEYIHSTFAKTYFTIKHSEGISLLPGYFLSESTLFYGRIGYANGRLKISESDPTIRSATKNRSGIRYGLGIRHALTPRLTLMMDYSQINYQSITGSVVEPFGMVYKKTKITPNTAQVGFGLIYNFDQPENVFVK